MKRVDLARSRSGALKSVMCGLSITAASASRTQAAPPGPSHPPQLLPESSYSRSRRNEKGKAPKCGPRRRAVGANNYARVV